MNEIEAIKILKKYWLSHGTVRWADAIRKAISALEVQQRDMWIPITEDETTYPEPFTEVIFTDGDYIYIGCCDPECKWSSTNQENSIQVKAVIAWKPLPTPFKKKKHNKENANYDFVEVGRCK